MNSPTCTKSTQIERTTCSRCGGSGRMPFSVYNGLCFKCRGQGYTLTKRGAVANQYLRDLRSRPASELKAGDLIEAEYFSINGSSVRYFARISSVEVITADNCGAWSVKPDGTREPLGLGQLRITVTSDKFGINVSSYEPARLVRVAQTAEQKAETLAKALAYQDTLTKAGTPRK